MQQFSFEVLLESWNSENASHLFLFMESSINDSYYHCYCANTTWVGRRKSCV